MKKLDQRIDRALELLSLKPDKTFYVTTSTAAISSAIAS
jgi:hypothetical protein